VQGLGQHMGSGGERADVDATHGSVPVPVLQCHMRRQACLVPVGSDGVVLGAHHALLEQAGMLIHAHADSYAD